MSKQIICDKQLIQSLIWKTKKCEQQLGYMQAVNMGVAKRHQLQLRSVRCQKWNPLLSVRCYSLKCYTILLNLLGMRYTDRWVNLWQLKMLLFTDDCT